MRAEQLESRDVPAPTAWLDASGMLQVRTDDPGIVMRQLPVGDCRLPADAIAHPENYVGSPDADFWWVQDRDGSVWIGHVDAVRASFVIVDAPYPDDGGTTTTGTTGTTGGTGTTPTGTATGTGTSAGESASGSRIAGGGLYSLSGGVVVDTDGKHKKKHDKPEKVKHVHVPHVPHVHPKHGRR